MALLTQLKGPKILANLSRKDRNGDTLRAKIGLGKITTQRRRELAPESLELPLYEENPEKREIPKGDDHEPELGNRVIVYDIGTGKNEGENNEGEGEKRKNEKTPPRGVIIIDTY